MRQYEGALSCNGRTSFLGWQLFQFFSFFFFFFFFFFEITCIVSSMKWASITPRESPKAASITLPADGEFLYFLKVGNQFVFTALNELLFQIQHISSSM